MSCSVVDLFCGIGGLTKGLELSNLNVVAGIDIDENCRYPYEANNNAKFILHDITDIDPTKIHSLYPTGDIKILVGCAPCQPFSRYTKRYRKMGYHDDKWGLLYSFARLIKEVKPEIISMENVPELIKEKVFSDFTEILNCEGYEYSWKIVYCPDYGVPQKRKRLVLLASSFGHIELIPPTHSKDNYPTVRDAIGNLPTLENGEVDTNDPVHRATKLSETNLKRIRQSVPGGTWKEWSDDLKLSCHTKPTGNSYGSVYGRMSWDEPSPTITTQYYGYGNGRFGHPEQDRAISYREGAILQSFPPDYILLPKDNKTYSMHKLGAHIGNAVPVNLGKAIGISIQNHILDVEANEKNQSNR